MALPTTNLTWHLDSADTDRLWRQTGMSSHPTDGQNVQAWDDEGDVTGYALFSGNGVDTDCPIYSAAGFNGIGCLVFNGVDELLQAYTDGWGSNGNWDNFVTVSTYTYFIALILDGASSTNDASTPLNEPILFGDASLGLYVKSNGGTHTLMAYNWDGTDDHADAVVSLSTKYVVMVKHAGGTLSIDVNNGAIGGSVASGDTDSVAKHFRLMGTTGRFVQGTVGEFAIYNADVTGTDLTDAWAYFMAKWVNAGAAPSILRQMMQLQ
jgi:hypothetical protein